MSSIKKFDNDTLTEDQFNEVFQTGSIMSLAPSQRSSYLYWLAKSLGLNPYVRPFDLIAGQNGTLVVYANRSASDQLRQVHKLTQKIQYQGPLILGPDKYDETVYQVIIETTDGQRTEIENGCVSILELRGEALANAVMKAVTKAKRRGTISFCGLGFPDESELGSWNSGPPLDIPVTVVEPSDKVMLKMLDAPPQPPTPQVSDSRPAQPKPVQKPLPKAVVPKMMGPSDPPAKV